MTKPKRIGVLTSGGDCGGLNAVIRAVVRRARDYDMEIYGIKGATQGLMNRPVEAELLDMKKVSGILRYGGTILGTVNKGNPLTENSIGFNTAVSVAVEALDHLTYTAISHSRVMILEVMGRDAGHIAVSAGIAGGAHIILIPEIPYDLDEICDRLMNRALRGFNFSTMVVAEAVKTPTGEPVTYTNSLGQKLYGGIGQYLGDQISTRTGMESRISVLGHVQRGSTPSPLDRILGAAFGVAAVDLAAKDKYDRMVAWSNREVIDVPIADAIAQYSAVDIHGTLIRTAIGLGTYVGELG